ncbi:MAG TPA: HAMP domain-containing sensor histidine kinase [Mycobacteriales bacterium]
MAERFSGSRRLRGTPTLRLRLTLVSTILLGFGIAAGAALLAATVSRTLQQAIDSGALQTAREIAALIDAGRLPDPVPVGGEGTAAIQVVDSQGRVRAASAGTDRLVPVLTPVELAAVRSGERILIDGDRIGLDGPLRAVAAFAGPQADRRTVVVAVDYGAARSGVRYLALGLAIGAPLLLLVVAVAVWYVVGRTLRPVESLRRGAEEITGAGGSARLPVPTASDEIHRLARTLNDMLARLEGASARQRAFVSDAAHELRSPLASARTQLEVAAAVDAGTPAGDLARDVLLDVERLGRLVDDLLLLARLDEAPARRRAPDDLYGLVRDVVDRYAAARVPVTLTGVEVTATVDRGGLARALINLVDNAVRHASTAVEVSVGAGADGAVLTVTDDGKGIPAAERDRVFDRFTRLDEGRDRESGGAGLGLAIVRELVRAHGGTVVLEDAEPGLRAVVTLPR